MESQKAFQRSLIGDIRLVEHAAQRTPVSFVPTDDESPVARIPLTYALAIQFTAVNHI